MNQSPNPISGSPYQHQRQPVMGILITNLGTPDAPTTTALRRYLKQFLWDPRVVDLPRLIWWFMLRVILMIRPAKSARSYQKIWDNNTGSPLLSISIQQLQALRKLLADSIDRPIVVELGMRYGNPSIASALQKLRDANAQQILVLPLYPQYSSSTTASTFDEVAKVVKSWRWVPEFRFINQYHDDPGYIDALANSVKEAWAGHKQPGKLLFSFHGTPERFLLSGDPYFCQCHKTARLVAERLLLQDDQWQLTFQSIFGREPWLQPYTIETLTTLANQGIASVDVSCPGYSADCLETLEEIKQENCHAYQQAGGGEFHYIPALNVRMDHIKALADIIRHHSANWGMGLLTETELKLRKDLAQRLGA